VVATLSSVQPTSVDHADRPRFPALDPEPPPRPWWRRLLGPAAVIVVAAAVTVAIMDWPALTGRAHHATGSRAGGVVASGLILAQTGTGGLVLARPGGKPATLSTLGQFPVGLTAASDMRYVWLGDGQALSLASLAQPAVTITNRHAHPLVIQTKVRYTANTQRPLLSPFAGHDRYIVLLSSFYGMPQAKARITVNSTTTGKAAALGTGDVAAGDPQSEGVFVSVAAPPRASAHGNQITPDGRLELRVAGHRPKILATAATLNHALGASRSRQVALTPYPSPSGSDVAVGVETVTANPTEAIVVLSRAGKMIDTPLPPGPPAGLAWSPDGTSLAYVTLGARGRDLTIWNAGGGSITGTFPFTGARYSTCVWSPDGVSVLCSDYTGAHWAVAPARGGQMTAIPGHGVPVAWIR
jgi:hypothetical protein